MHLAGVQTKQKNPEESVSEKKLICAFTEGKKENISPPIENLESTSLVQNLFPTPKSKISISPIDVFSDSPIRRQTYTINSMLRESHIGTKINAMSSFSLNQSKNEVVLKEKQVECYWNNLPSHPQPKKTIVNKIISTENDCNESLNDSLEVSPTEPVLDNTSLLASCSIDSTNHNFTSSSVMDAVKVLDSSAKHFYFGYTPPVKNTNAARFVPPNSLCFKTDKIEEEDANSTVNNLSTFVLNQLDAKQRTLSSSLSPEKRLTFTATFANINTPPFAANHYKPALSSNMKHLDDSLDECALVTKQESKDSLQSMLEAIRGADPFPLSSCLPASYNLMEIHQVTSSQPTAMVEELDGVKTSHSSVTFEIKSEFPKPFKMPFDNQGLVTSKQKHLPKMKQKTVVQKKPGRKLVRELKLNRASSKPVKKSPEVKLAAKNNQTGTFYIFISSLYNFNMYQL